MSDDEKQELARQINRMVAKTLQRYLMAIVAVFVMVFGWHEIRLINHEKKIQEISLEQENLKSDFGYSEGTLHERYPDNLVFQSNYQKYVIRRGGGK
jgi:hypothetical protein